MYLFEIFKTLFFLKSDSPYVCNETLSYRILASAVVSWKVYKKKTSTVSYRKPTLKDWYNFYYDKTNHSFQNKYRNVLEKWKKNFTDSYPTMTLNKYCKNIKGNNFLE